MSNEPLEVIEIDDNWRYACYYDDSAFDYLHDYDNDSWGLFTIRHSQWVRDLALNTFGINDRLSSVMEWTEHSWNHKHAETELGKSITRAGYNYEFVQLNGGSQCSWSYVVVYWNDYITEPKGLIDEIKAWYAGEVFTVCLERRDVYYGPNGKTIETWELEEAVSQVIFTRDYQFVADVAEELLGRPQLAAA